MAAKTLFFGDGDHDFLFLIDDWRELQRKTEVGPYELERKLVLRRATADDILETVRVGLIGGGMKPVEAYKLATAYIGKRTGDLDTALLVAIDALQHSLHEVESDIMGESQAAETATSPIPTEESPSPAC